MGNRPWRCCSWSGGKDSTATILLDYLYDGHQIDEIVFCEVMYDLSRGISAESPTMQDFIYRAKEVFEAWGYKVTILRSSNRDFMYSFHHIMEERRCKIPDHGNKRHGFPVVNHCSIQRDCKVKPMKEYLASYGANLIQYIGMAVDEPKRLESMKRTYGNKGPQKVSLLEKYGYTEEMAKALCEKYGLLSPMYKEAETKRGGCWFCPWSKSNESVLMKERNPKIWEEFVSLEKDVLDVAYKQWNPITKETLAERDAKVDRLIKERNSHCRYC